MHPFKIPRMLIQSLFSMSLIGAISFLQYSYNYYSTSLAEICDNAIDDDNDGLVDINDPDCNCEIIIPKSLIPNPSFEDRQCCPASESALGCATDWIQASGPTTDYLHTCGWMGWRDFPPPQPFPDGQGCVGFRDGRYNQNNGLEVPSWKEYAGACLLSPLKAGVTYRFEFHIGFVDDRNSPPINVTFFGTHDCAYLPFGLENIQLGCPTNGPNWVNLGSKMVSGGNKSTWVKTYIEVTPKQDIYAIAIGPDCPNVLAGQSIYYFFDNLLLDDIASFDMVIKTNQRPCSENFSIQVADKPDLKYQWYRNGIAILGEKSYKLNKLTTDGDYQVRIVDKNSCRLSDKYSYTKPLITNTIQQYICRDDVYKFGDKFLNQKGTYSHTFKTTDKCDSLVTLHLTIQGTEEDTINATIFEGQSFQVGTQTYQKKGKHPVKLISSLGCDSLLLLNLDFYEVYFPNIFSPNGDGINDIFTVYDRDGLIESKEIIIFDRWGEKLYSGDAWDGTYKGLSAQIGVYPYVVKIKMKDNALKQFNGSVTIVK